jgi:aspartate 1-decarboxylase
MKITLMRAKSHRAYVTQADLNYEGSISIDETLLNESGILENEMVDVLNINNGERFTTYAIKAKKDSGEIKINGAAARKVQINDPVIIIAYGAMKLEEAKNFKSKVVLVDSKNKILK